MVTPGWFNFERTYDRAVALFDNGAAFVEVGAWLGASAIYMAHAIWKSQKQISLYVVDTWSGCQTTPNDLVERERGSIYHLFLENIAREGVDELIVPLQMESAEAAQHFEDGALDFVFIDATHTYSAVLADLKAWYPKIAPEGVLAGHDYSAWPGVAQAVHEFFGSANIQISDDDCFWHEKE